MAFTPGHYCLITEGWTQARANDFFTRCPKIKGLQIRYPWKDLETAPGVFNFNPILNDLAFLASSNRPGGPKKLIAQIQGRSYIATGVTPTAADVDFPLYIFNNSALWYIETTSPFDLITPLFWNTTVRNNYRNMLQAIIPSVLASPNASAFEGVWNAETAVTGSLAPGGYTLAGYVAAMNVIHTAAMALLPGRLYGQNISGPATLRAAFIQDAITSGWGVGRPNLILGEQEDHNDAYGFSPINYSPQGNTYDQPGVTVGQLITEAFSDGASYLAWYDLNSKPMKFDPDVINGLNNPANTPGPFAGLKGVDWVLPGTVTAGLF